MGKKQNRSKVSFANLGSGMLAAFIAYDAATEPDEIARLHAELTATREALSRATSNIRTTAKKKKKAAKRYTRAQSVCDALVAAKILGNGEPITNDSVIACADIRYANETKKKLNPRESTYVFTVVRTTLATFGLAMTKNAQIGITDSALEQVKVVDC